MRARHVCAFNDNFRGPGSDVEGPIYYAFGQTNRAVVLAGNRGRGYRWGVERRRAPLAEEEYEQ